MIILGIDPGLSGALAFLDTKTGMISVEDMPTVTVMRNCTPAMLDAGSAAHPAGGYVRGTLLTDIIEAEWRAMIDAALEEK